MRSWATCWSMIQRPSSLVARMKESRSWPRGLRGERAFRVSARCGLPVVREAGPFDKLRAGSPAVAKDDNNSSGRAAWIWVAYGDGIGEG